VNRAGGVAVGGTKVRLEFVILDDESDAMKTVARFESRAADALAARNPRTGRGRGDRPPLE
jgi:hypothetical protein